MTLGLNFGNLTPLSHTNVKTKICLFSYRRIAARSGTQRSSEDPLDAPKVSVAQVCGADNQIVTRTASHPGALAGFGAHEAGSSATDPGRRTPGGR